MDFSGSLGFLRVFKVFREGMVTLDIHINEISNIDLQRLAHCVLHSYEEIFKSFKLLFSSKTYNVVKSLSFSLAMFG